MGRSLKMDPMKFSCRRQEDMHSCGDSKTTLWMHLIQPSPWSHDLETEKWKKHCKRKWNLYSFFFGLFCPLTILCINNFQVDIYSKKWLWSAFRCFGQLMGDCICVSPVQFEVTFLYSNFVSWAGIGLGGLVMKTAQD